MKRTHSVKGHDRKTAAGVVRVPRHRRSTVMGKRLSKLQLPVIPPPVDAVSSEEQALQAARGAMPQPGMPPPDPNMLAIPPVVKKPMV